MVRRADGVIALDGTFSLQPDRAYTVEEVVRLAEGPAGSVRWGLSALTSPPMSRVIGGAAFGPQVSLLARDNEGAGRGFSQAAHLGVAFSPSRSHLDARVRAARPVFQVAGDLGYQGDVHRFRGRVGWGGSLVWIPPSWVEDRPDDPDPLDHLSSAGWVFGAMGPSGSASWILPGGWSVGADVRAHVAVLDPVGDGLVVVPWVTTGLAVEVVR